MKEYVAPILCFTQNQWAVFGLFLYYFFLGAVGAAPEIT